MMLISSLVCILGIEPSTHLRVYVALESFTADIATACNRDVPYETSTYNTLVKEGKLIWLVFNGNICGTCVSIITSYLMQLSFFYTNDVTSI
jgi:hypothetical protein